MNLIPKIINYCWFGHQPMTPLALKCLESWKEYLPDYKMLLWDESSFKVHNSRYTWEAYKHKKYAFVSDYVRLFALYHVGGIYLDMDVELIKNFDKFLDKPAFSGFENPDFLQSGVIGAMPRHPWIKCFFDYYKTKPFIQADGSMNLIPNVRFMTTISEKKFGLISGNEFQILKDDVHIYPNDYFCPMVWETKEIILTQNTHCIHHFAASWMD